VSDEGVLAILALYEKSLFYGQIAWTSIPSASRRE
jgi:hypothetical protein